jgi:hypothetical protein
MRPLQIHEPCTGRYREWRWRARNLVASCPACLALDIGRPRSGGLVFERRVTRRTPGRFHARVIAGGVTPSLHIDYKQTIKQCDKLGQALCNETTIKLRGVTASSSPVTALTSSESERKLRRNVTSRGLHGEGSKPGTQSAAFASWRLTLWVLVPVTPACAGLSGSGSGTTPRCSARHDPAWTSATR